MNRDTLFRRLEDTMLVIGKGIQEEPKTFSVSSPAQNHVLMVIGMHGDMGVKQLARILQVTSGAATQHIDALEKSGLLAREMNSKDRREVVIKITEKGSQAYREIWQTKSRMLRELFGGLSDPELQTFVSLFEKVAQKYMKNKDMSYETV